MHSHCYRPVIANYNPSDDELLELVATELAKNAPKQFIVLHTYGSHFNYRERYPSENAFFLPDFPVDAEVKYKDNLVNAYDNSIRYTDDFLARLIGMLQEQNTDAAMLYSSDHGEDILMIADAFSCMRHRFRLITRYMCRSYCGCLTVTGTIIHPLGEYNIQ